MHRFGARVQAFGTTETELAQHAQVGAGTGADVEDARVRRQAEAADAPAEQPAALGEPPVRGFDLRCDRVRGAVHSLAGGWLDKMVILAATLLGSHRNLP